MALSVPVQIAGTNNFTSGGLTTLATGAASAGAAVGDLIIVVCGGNRTTTTSIADGASNTYSAAQNTASGTNSQCSIHYSIITNPIVNASTTFTGTWGTSSPDRFIYVFKVTGAAAVPLDQNTGSNTISNNWSSGATGTLAQAAELAIGVSTDNTSAAGVTSTPGGSYTELVDVSTSDAVSFTVTYLITTTTAAQTASGTWSGGTPGAMRSAIATFKEAAVGGGISPWVMSNNRTGPQALRNNYKSQIQIPYVTPPSPPSTTTGGNLPTLGVG